MAAVASPTVWGPRLSMPFLLASTIIGYLIGVALPEAVSAVAHPLITCTVFANVGAAILGSITGVGYLGALHSYLIKVSMVHGNLM